MEEDVCVLVCQHCEFPIVEPADVIEEKFPETFKEAVFCYELQLFDKQFWCYSATNPGQHRFDVIRAKPSSIGIQQHGKFDSSHSWFPGFAWNMAICAVCSEHLGWGFSPWPANPPEAPLVASFVGLILTKLRERHLPKSHVRALHDAATRLFVNQPEVEAEELDTGDSSEEPDDNNDENAEN